MSICENQVRCLENSNFLLQKNPSLGVEFAICRYQPVQAFSDQCDMTWFWVRQCPGHPQRLNQYLDVLVHLKLREAQETKLVTKQMTASQFKASQMITEYHFTDVLYLLFVAFCCRFFHASQPGAMITPEHHMKSVKWRKLWDALTSMSANFLFCQLTNTRDPKSSKHCLSSRRRRCASASKNLSLAARPTM